MKLDKECVRDLLIYIEENANQSHPINLVHASIGKYNKNDVYYTAEKLIEAGLINGSPYKSDNGKIFVFNVSSLTWNGHEFLDTIRDPKVWRETKSKLSQFASVSLSMIVQVASTVLASMISNGS